MYPTSLKPLPPNYLVRLLVVVSLLVSSPGWGGLLRQSPFVPGGAFTAATPSHSTTQVTAGSGQPEASGKVGSDRDGLLAQPNRGNHLTMEDAASLPAALYAAWLAQQQAEGGPAYSLVKGQAEGASDWTATNGAQGLKLEFQPGVVKVNDWGIELNTSSPPQVAGNRIEYQETSGLREWYVNGPLGLEQGFTLTQPLPQTDQDGWLALAVPFEGVSVQAQDQNKEWLGLVGANGQQVGQYGKLYATDARGKVLDSQLEPSEDGKAAILRVKVAAASYPLTIDPFVQQARLTNSDGASGDVFGVSVALSSDGSTALIGAYFKTIGANSRQGAAYIFTRSGLRGSYSQSQRLTNSDGASGDYFGISVALSSDGSTALIGASGKTIGANTQQGVAYIFTRNGVGGSYSQSQRLTNADGADSDNFGYSVALSSDGATALIGAYFKIIGANPYQGAAYIFTKSGVGSGYSQSQRLTNSDGASSDYFGYSVTLSSDGATALISAEGKTIGANTGQGAAYIFTRGGGGGSYSQSQRLTNSDGATNDLFGYSVALSSDGATALIGAWGKTIGANRLQGAAYIFTRSGLGGSYSQSQRLTNADGATNDLFGRSVALSSDGATALIGANNKTIGANTGQGAAYIFTRGGVGGSYSQSQRLTNSDGASGDYFGNPVALSSDGATTLIGASGKTIGANSQQGAAYTFTFITPTSVSLSSSPNPSSYGQSVTFTATLSPVGASGTVTFSEGASVLGVAPLVSATAVFTTASLTVGTHLITATYSGDPSYAPALSQPVTQVVQAACAPLVVTLVTDDGTGTNCGSLSYALSQPIIGSSGVTITFALTAGNTITFTGSLTVTAKVKAGVTIYGGAAGSVSRIILNGNGVAGDGLHLVGNNHLVNLTIEHFAGRELVLEGSGNRLQGVLIRAT